MPLFNESLLRELNYGNTQQLSGLSPAEGVIVFLLAAVMADDVISNDEKEMIWGTVARMKMFRSYSQDVVGKIFAKVGQDFNQYVFKAVIFAAKEAIPYELRNTVFAIATDLVLSDGILSEEEATVLTMMHHVLEVPESTAQQVIQVIAMKNKG